MSLRSFLLLLLTIAFVNIVRAGDTVVVKTLTFNDITKRSGTYLFPPKQSYEKVLMYYTLKCDPRTTQDRFPCGEWDYLTYNTVTDSTGEYDSTLQLSPNFRVRNTTPPTFGYTTSPVTSKMRYYERFWRRTSVSIERTDTVYKNRVGTNTTLFNTSPQRTQFIYPAADLTTAGVKAGPILALRMISKKTSGLMKRLTIRMKQTTLKDYRDGRMERDGFTTVYSRGTALTDVNPEFTLTTPFSWDGTSNLVIDVSCEGGTPDGRVETTANLAYSSLQIIGTERAYAFTAGDMMTLPIEVGNSISDEVTVAFWTYGEPQKLPAAINAFEAYDDKGRRVMNAHLPWDQGRVYWDCGIDPVSGSFDRIEQDAQAFQYKGQWNHWAFVKNSKTGIMQMFLNGSLFFSGNGKSMSMRGITKFVMGSGGSGSYEGMLDDIQVWNKALDSTTIKAYMYKSIDAAHPNIANLQAYYRCSEASGLTAADASGKEHHATLFGVPTRPTIPASDLRNDPIPSDEGRLNVVFVRGTATQTLDSTAVDVTIPTKQLSLVLFDNPCQRRIYRPSEPNQPTTPTDTLLVYEAGVYSYTVDQYGKRVDSVMVTAETTLTRVNREFFSPVVTWEIGRYITPYGINLDLGPNGFRWVYDVTDFAPILRNNVTLSAGNQQELIDLTFVFIKGTPPRTVKQLDQIVDLNSVNYSDVVKGTALPAIDVLAHPDARSFRVKTTTSGHAFSNPTNCAEFCPRFHWLKVDGTEKSRWLLWKECAMNPVYPQGGTWLIDRTGWCPGAPVDFYDHDITSSVTPGRSVSIDYGIDADSTNGAHGNWVVSSQFIGYGPANFALDAGLVDVISPNNWEFYSRMNPICGQPVVVLRNTGSAVLKSVTFTYGLTDGTQSTYTWNGDLAFMDQDTVALPPPNWGSGDGAKKFLVQISKPNGGTDGYEPNNIITTNIVLPPVWFPDVTIALKTNNFAPEQYVWKLRRLDNDSVIGSGENLESNKTFENKYTLANGCYEYELVNKLDYGLDFWFLRDQLGTGSLVMRNGTNALSFNPDFGHRAWIQFRIAPKPSVGVSADTVRFGPVAPGAFQERVVKVYPKGEIPLRVKSITCFQLKGHFTTSGIVPDTAGGVVLQPGDTMYVTVKFLRSDEGTSSGTLRIETNDERTANVIVRLIGVASTASSVAEAELALADQVDLGVLPNPVVHMSEAVVVVHSGAIANTHVVVRDVLGRVVATLFDGTLPEGEQRFVVPATLTAGLYFLSLESDRLRTSVPFTVVQ